jgi:hypothetical protein
MTDTEFSKKQLAAILSALDDAPRNPANRGEAMRAIGRSAERFGLTAEDVLAAAAGLLECRLSPAEFRTELQDQGSAPVPATEALQGAPQAQEGGTVGQEAEAPAEPARAAQEARPARRRAKAAKSAKSAKAGSTDKPTPRTGTKQAILIELLSRPEGATVEQIAEVTGWQKHTIRGAISGALKKKLGLKVEATRAREVGPNETGAKSSSTVYRIVG